MQTRNKRIIVMGILFVASPHVSRSQTVDKPSNQKLRLNQVPIPIVRFLYPPGGSVFDRTCPQLLKQQIDAEWVQETVRRVQEFQRLWDQQGPAYLSATFSEFGFGLPYSEMQAALTVCPVPSMSIPLMINVKRFLSTEQNSVPLEHFPEIVFHELMHHYTYRVNPVSELRKKYSEEHPQVISHLHVMALEKFVLLKLGKTGELKYLDYQYRNSPPHYRRAWEIVNDIEGHESLIKELKLVRSR